MTPPHKDDLAEVKATMIELEVTLRRLIEDVKVVPGLKERTSRLELLSEKTDELYALIYIGGSQEPMAQRVRSNSRSIKWAREEIAKLKRAESAKTIGPRERIAIYTLIAGAITGSVKAYLATH